VIHAHDLLSPSTIALASSAFLGAPVVAKVLRAGPDGDIRRLSGKPLGAWRLRAVANRFAAFICLSREVEDELAQHGIARDRLRRIPNGVDTAHFRPPTPDHRGQLRIALDLPRAEPLVLYCGRFTKAKRLEVLLEAVRPLPGHLVLAGGGPTESKLRRLVAETGMEGRVHFRGTLDDPGPLYQAADVYASASRSEGMSNSVLEAMASGLPVAASPASGMSELVMPQTGRLASDGSAEALRRALVELLGQSSGRVTLGERARQLVVRDYSLDATAERLMALYREVSANGLRGGSPGRPR
jgi:glycosyltransferase involved in cell wall biosynthesis